MRIFRNTLCEKFNKNMRFFFHMLDYQVFLAILRTLVRRISSLNFMKIANFSSKSFNVAFTTECQKWQTIWRMTCEVYKTLKNHHILHLAYLVYISITNFTIFSFNGKDFITSFFSLSKSSLNSAYSNSFTISSNWSINSKASL